MVSRPAATFPVASAAIMLSPPPVETCTSAGRSSSAAIVGASVNVVSSGTSGGSNASRSRCGSIACSSSGDQRRWRTSSQPVPEASPYSA